MQTTSTIIKSFDFWSPKKRGFFIQLMCNPWSRCRQNNRISLMTMIPTVPQPTATVAKIDIISRLLKTRNAGYVWDLWWNLDCVHRRRVGCSKEEQFFPCQFLDIFFDHSPDVACVTKTSADVAGREAITPTTPEKKKTAQIFPDDTRYARDHTEIKPKCCCSRCSGSTQLTVTQDECSFIIVCREHNREIEEYPKWKHLSFVHFISSHFFSTSGWARFVYLCQHVTFQTTYW